MLGLRFLQASLWAPLRRTADVNTRALLPALLETFGAKRGPVYAELPKWRQNARRPSCLDLIALPRKEMAQQSQLIASRGLKTIDQSLVQVAAA